MMSVTPVRLWVVTLDDVSLGRQMAAAARAATEAAIAAGHSRGDKVTVDSAKRAADEVYLRARGQHVAAEPRVIDQPRRGEAPPVVEATLPVPPVSEPLEDAWQARRDLD